MLQRLFSGAEREEIIDALKEAGLDEDVKQYYMMVVLANHLKIV